MKHSAISKASSILSIYLWLGIFALIPFMLVIVLSFLQYSDTQIFTWHITFSNYQQLFTSVFFRIFIRSFELAAICTAICLLIGYPTAYFLNQASEHIKPFFIMLLIIPFWTSSLIRTYAILTLIKAKGLINSLLLAIGLIHQPLQILYTNYAVVIGIVYNLLPYMILPLFTNIEKLDPKIFDAARDLGASRLTIFRKITLPLTLPGIVAGVMLVFLPAMTLFYIPDILGGAKSLLLGNLIENQFLVMNNWPSGCATSVVLTLLMLILILVYRLTNRDSQMQGLL